MIAAGVKGLWEDAIQWATYTKNRIPHTTLGKSPIEVLFNKKVDRSNLKPFGQRVMVHIYKDQRGGDRMAARAVPARIVGHTKTHRTYQVISETGKRALAKNPQPIDQTEKDSDGEEESSEWPTKPVQDLEDIAEGRLGRNYGWHCPEKEGCPKETQKTETPPDSPSQQLFRELEPPLAPSKPKAPEPLRRSERMGRDVTNWQDRIKQGLAGGSTVSRVGHDEDHPTDEQAQICPKAHEWTKARQIE